MFAAQPTEHLPRRLGTAGLHVREALLYVIDAFDITPQSTAVIRSEYLEVMIVKGTGERHA
jgi:hypothetical protein